jgi:co-chaperonin GroES (HSP10)
MTCPHRNVMGAPHDWNICPCEQCCQRRKRFREAMSDIGRKAKKKKESGLNRTDWQPLGNYYRVEITPPATVSAGGVLLPQQDLWQCNEGVVTAVGRGRTEEPGLFLPQARVGERVLFQRMDLEPGPNENEAVIADADLVGIVCGNKWGVEPCGEWLLLRPDGRKEETAGGLAVPEHYQKRQRSGTLLACGPGRLRQRGLLRGTRLPCAVLLDAEGVGTLVGMRVYWNRNSTLLFRQGSEDWALVEARDIIATEKVKENDNGKLSYNTGGQLSPESGGSQSLLGGGD